MSDVVVNNNSAEGEEKSTATSADPATTTPADTAAVAATEPPAESAEKAALSDNTSQPAIVDSEQENKQAEESMEVEESKADTETVQNKETTEDNPAPNSANPTSSQETGNNEATMTPAPEVKSAGGDNAVTTTVSSNETKIKTETKDKRLKVDLSKAPVRQYLDATVVPILLGALSAVARERPANPVEYLGNYLLEKAKEFPTD